MNWKKLDLKGVLNEIDKQFKKHHLNAILVGGGCVTVYSENKYISKDLDMVSFDKTKSIQTALSEIGFIQKGRHFIHPDCQFYLEFPPPPVAIGEETIEKFHKLDPKNAISILSPTDCVKDRLAAFYHWGDYQSLDQALLVASQQKIDLKEIARWSKKERQMNGFDIFKSRLKQINQ